MVLLPNDSDQDDDEQDFDDDNDGPGVNDPTYGFTFQPNSDFQGFTFRHAPPSPITPVRGSPNLSPQLTATNWPPILHLDDSSSDSDDDNNNDEKDSPSLSMNNSNDNTTTNTDPHAMIIRSLLTILPLLPYDMITIIMEYCRARSILVFGKCINQSVQSAL
jgi:hypothetical protein